MKTAERPAKPVRWDYRDDPNRYRIHEVISGLATLKTDYPDPFQTTNFNWDVGGYGKRLHLNGESMNAIVVANFQVTNLSMIPGFQHTGTWYDYFSGEPLQIDDINAFMDFAPGEYHVYVDQEIDFPAHVQSLQAPATSSAPFPNPTSGMVQWAINQPEALQAIRVFDAKGALIMDAASFTILSNGQGLQLDLSVLPSGIYSIFAIGNESFDFAQVHIMHER